VTVRLIQPAATPLAVSPGKNEDRPRLTCAFVNNMPDGAFDASERQFLDLLDGAGTGVIEVRRYTMPRVPRGGAVAAKIAEQYSPTAAIRQDPPDLLIVTGSNPVEPRLEDEPYWDDMVDLLTWSSEHVPSMLLSCLSAHAALTIFDGVERERLPSKCTGVFPQLVDVTHPLGAGLEPEIILPHSRTSTVPQEALRQTGYQIVIQSEGVGWSVAAREVARSNVILVQGHPEYDPSSLLREYHRDARRYVRHERDDIPRLPLHCVAPGDWEDLEKLHRAIIGDQRDPALLEAYPFDEVGARATWPWHEVAKTLYTNCLVGITKRSDRSDAR
jgi:homoserine O-succinyltransferase/O-acetyltransferase